MNNDLISREALKAEVALMFGDKTHITESVCEVIDNAPTVELFCHYQYDGEVKEPCVEGPCPHERPQSEWICITKSTFPQYQPDEYKCSQCNKLCHIKYYFCPFCGAKMKEGEK